MGARPVGVRVVIDTNVVVSTLVFESDRFTWLRAAWRTGEVVPVVSRETVAELMRVLAYPKFQLDEAEIAELLSDYLPFAEIAPGQIAPSQGAPEQLDEAMRVADPHDQPFVDLAVHAQVEVLVSGDAHLLALADKGDLRVMTPAKFRIWWTNRTG